MRVIIVGAGAVGGLLGAMLASAGTEVAFVARGAALERLRTKGIRVESPGSVLEVGPVSADEDPARLAPADAVFITVKSWQLADVAARLVPILKPTSAVVSLLNGVDAAEVLAAHVGPERVVGGLCHVLASVTSPGEIHVRGAPLRVTLGELGGGGSPRVNDLKVALEAAGVAFVAAADVRVDLWEKLLFVGPLGMIGAATHLSADVFRAQPESRALLAEAMAEVRRVAVARGVRVPEDAAARALARLDTLPAGSRTSMQRDLEAGRPSEIEAQLGVIVRMAAEAHLDAPVHRVLHAALAARERVARG